MSTTDAIALATQLAGRSRAVSLVEPVHYPEGCDEPLLLGEGLAAPVEDPAMAAGRNLDWEKLLASMDDTAREVLSCLVQGTDLTKLVRKLKRSRSSLQNDKQRLAWLIREHLGENILQLVQQQPG